MRAPIDRRAVEQKGKSERVQENGSNPLACKLKRNRNGIGKKWRLMLDLVVGCSNGVCYCVCAEG